MGGGGINQMEMKYAHRQINQKISHLSAYLQAGWLNVRDFGIVGKDLNNSENPQNMLFCREISETNVRWKAGVA